jgi:hypothetical protein
VGIDESLRILFIAGVLLALILIYSREICGDILNFDWDPESGIQYPGWTIEHPVSYFRELRLQFFWVKNIKFFDADPRSGVFSTRDPDKHHGFATLLSFKEEKIIQQAFVHLRAFFAYIASPVEMFRSSNLIKGPFSQED